MASDVTFKHHPSVVHAVCFDIQVRTTGGTHCTRRPRRRQRVNEINKILMIRRSCVHVSGTNVMASRLGRGPWWGQHSASPNRWVILTFILSVGSLLCNASMTHNCLSRAFYIRGRVIICTSRELVFTIVRAKCTSSGYKITETAETSSRLPERKILGIIGKYAGSVRTWPATK